MTDATPNPTPREADHPTPGDAKFCEATPTAAPQEKRAASPRHPTVVNAGQALNMAHVALVEWSVETPEGADSGMFSVNLSRPMLVRLVREGDARRVILISRQDEIASIRATPAGAQELYSDLWNHLNLLRNQFAQHHAQARKSQGQVQALPDQRSKSKGSKASPGRKWWSFKAGRATAAEPFMMVIASSALVLLIAIILSAVLADMNRTPDNGSVSPAPQGPTQNDGENEQPWTPNP